ncbi:MAG: chlorite dismutase family protein [Parvularculaceae bacterium]|nr:chlorite dismutase family protein [Parvularculaceae bacterium]
MAGASGALCVRAGDAPPPGAKAASVGIASNVRYATRQEVTDLRSVQEPLGRRHARSAALIPISKSAEWWAVAQNERRAIFQEQSRRHSIGTRYLPEIARKLYHSRDLGQPFDFLTWFEFAPEHEMMFNDLLKALRASKEWTYVTREIDIRLSREE